MALIDGLLSWYGLNQLSDGSAPVTRNDEHGTNHLTDNNTVGSIAGKVGDAASFVASSSESLTGANPGFGGGSFSISVWLQLTTIDDFLAVIATGGTSSQGFLLYKRNDTDLRMTISDGVTTLNKGVPPPVVGAWMHYGFVLNRDAGTIRAFKDGAEWSTATFLPAGFGSVDNANGLSIGKRGDGSLYFFTGYLDEVGLWNRALTDAEIAELWNAGVGVSYADIAGGSETPVSLSGTAQGQAQSDAQALRQILMEAAAQGSGAATAALQALRNLEAFTLGSGGVEASLLIERELGGSAAGAGAAEAAISLARQLAGTASGTGSAEASLQLGSSLGGAAQGSGSAEASLLVSRFLQGIGSGQGSTTAATFRDLRLAAEAGGIGQAEGQLITDAAILLAAVAQGASGAEAEATIERLVSGRADGSGVATAVLLMERLVAGTVLGVGSATGTLVVAGTRVVIESASRIRRAHASESSVRRAYESSSNVRQIII